MPRTIGGELADTVIVMMNQRFKHRLATLWTASATPKIPLDRIRLLDLAGQESSLKDHVPDLSLLIFLRHLA